MPRRRARTTDDRSSRLDREVAAYLRQEGSPAQLYQGKVKPHPRSTERCTKCSQFHTLAEHARHAGRATQPRKGSASPSPRVARARAKKASAPKGLTDQVRDAYLRDSGGRLRERVRLADLRRLLPGVARDDLDRELRRLASRGEAALFPLDDGRERTAEDEIAAVALSGVPQHVIYLEPAPTSRFARPRLAIRPKEYRGVGGYSVTGRDREGRSVSVFTRTLDGAREVRQAFLDYLDPHGPVSNVLRRERAGER